jgi:hypothetical protein
MFSPEHPTILCACRARTGRSGGYLGGASVPSELTAGALPRTSPTEAQSDQIDTVSGATVTSDGYIGSLQSALDAAHLR